jgi:hypothetical protein
VNSTGVNFPDAFKSIATTVQQFFYYFTGTKFQEKNDACSSMLLCLYKRRKLLQVTTDRTNLWYDNSAACCGKKKNEKKMKYQPQWIRIFKSIHLSLLLKVELDSFILSRMSIVKKLCITTVIIYKRHSRDERSKKKALITYEPPLFFYINGQWCLTSSNLKIKLIALNLRDDMTSITCLWKQQLRIREWCL